MKAPRPSYVTVYPLVANIPTAAIPTNGSSKVTITAPNAFDILFSDDGTANIPDPVISLLPLLAGTYVFDLVSKNSHFKFISSSAYFEYWLDSKNSLNSNPTGVLDTISVSAQCAFSAYRRLRKYYAGAALRVRRSSDNAEQDIGFLGTFVDTAALLAFVGPGGSGFVTALYDQSGNGRHLAQAAAASQPRIVNAGVLETYPSGRPAMSFDGVDDRLFRTTTPTGLGANPDVTVGFTGQSSNNGPAFQFGVPSATGARVFYGRLGTLAKDHWTASKTFTPAVSTTTAGRYYVMNHVAGGDTQSGTLRQNGVDLAQASVGGTPAALNLLDQDLELGSFAAIAGGWFSGKLNSFLLFNAVLAGADLAALEAELAAHV